MNIIIPSWVCLKLASFFWVLPATRPTSDWAINFLEPILNRLPVRFLKVQSVCFLCHICPSVRYKICCPCSLSELQHSTPWISEPSYALLLFSSIPRFSSCCFLRRGNSWSKNLRNLQQDSSWGSLFWVQTRFLSVLLILFCINLHCLAVSWSNTQRYLSSSYFRAEISL